MLDCIFFITAKHETDNSFHQSLLIFQHKFRWVKALPQPCFVTLNTNVWQDLDRHRTANSSTHLYLGWIWHCGSHSCSYERLQKDRVCSVWEQVDTPRFTWGYKEENGVLTPVDILKYMKKLKEMLARGKETQRRKKKINPWFCSLIWSCAKILNDVYWYLETENEAFQVLLVQKNHEGLLRSNARRARTSTSVWNGTAGK